MHAIAWPSLVKIEIGAQVINNNLLAYAHKYYSGKKAKGATNHLVIRFQTYFIGGRMLSTSKSGQEPMVVELTDNRGECTTLFFYFLCQWAQNEAAF